MREVTRLFRHAAVIAAVSLVIGACSGGSGHTSAGANPAPGEPGTPPAQPAPPPELLQLEGRVLDGPVIGARVTAIDARGEPLVVVTSDETARFAFEIPAGTAFPVTLTAEGGVDQVTGAAPEFTLMGVAFDRGTAQLSTLGTLALHGARCRGAPLTRERVAAMEAAVLARHALAVDAERLPNPLRTPLDADVVAARVLANDAYAEAVRRTVRALARTGAAVTADAVLAAAGCGLTDPEGADARILAALDAAELAVRLETQHDGLVIDGVVATERLNDAVRLLFPDHVPNAAAPPATARDRQRLEALIGLLLEPAQSDALLSAAVALRRGRGQAPVTARLAEDLAALLDRLALADDASLQAFTMRRMAQPVSAPPEVRLSLDPSVVSAGGRARIRWGAVGADRCIATGGWEGSLGIGGRSWTHAVHADTPFRLVCAGLGGVTEQVATLMVRKAPAPPQPPESRPEPEPPVILFAAAPPAVGHGETSVLSWTAEHASHCWGSLGWGGARDVSGMMETPRLYAGRTFRLTCSGPGGNASADVNVHVQATGAPSPKPKPAVRLTVSPAEVEVGEPVTVSWSSEDAEVCVASGAWDGPRATAGETRIGPLVEAATITLRCGRDGVMALAMTTVSVVGDVELEWDPPTENVDGSPLTDLAGYRLYYVTTDGEYDDWMPVDKALNRLTIPLPAGPDYRFVMTAVDDDDNESVFSNEVRKRPM